MTAPVPPDETRAAHEPWWRRAVVYQIYPRSFADSGGDGVGDLQGIRAHLDHLEWLGVDALWLSPIYPSPMVDFGYDVSDHCDVDPVFGTLADFDELLDDVHRRGMRLLLDWVPNHTSDRHPWFADARRNRASAHRSWYVWRDPTPGGGPPNNWASSFEPGRPAWTFDEGSGQWYLHLFDPCQPDLNWDEPAVERAMHDVLRFWLDRGVDGFRADVIHCIGKDPALPDDPPDLAGIPHSALNDVAVTHERLRAIRRLVEGYPGDRVMVGEVYLLSTDLVAEYYGRDDELQLSFNFPPLFAPWWSAAWRRCIADTERAIVGRGGWPTWVLSNHDNPRQRTRADRQAARRGEDGATRARRSEARARAAAVVLLTLRGTPFLYQGEELGLVDAHVPSEGRLDPGGRDGCRAPLPWNGSADHGWPTRAGGTWLPFAPEADVRNVDALRSDETSILHLYRRLLRLRRVAPGLSAGALRLLDAPDGVLAYERSGGGERWTVLVNFSDATREMSPGCPEAGHPVVVASDFAGEGRLFGGRLGPDQAVVIRSRGGSD